MISEAREYCWAMEKARRWARETHQKLLPMLTTAIEKYIDYESQPHCSYCDGTEFEYHEGDCPTGVVSEDGVREIWFERWMKCKRCGSVEDI